MTRRWLVLGTTLLLMMVASAAAVANHSPGHDGGSDEVSQSVALEPGETAEVDCATDLSLNLEDGVWVLHCDELPEEEPEPTDPIEDPSDGGPILSDFSFTAGDAGAFEYIEGGFLTGLQQDSPHGVRTVTEAGPYQGWDVLLTDQDGETRTLATNNWITLSLSRDATVAVVWQADEPVPNWLDGWTHVGEPVVIEDSVSAKPRYVFEQDFEAGEVVLGGVWDEGESGHSRSPYLVVIGDGESTAPPQDDSDDGHQDDDSHHDDEPSDDGQHDDHSGGDVPGDGEYVSDVDEWLYGTHHWSVEPLSAVDTDALEQPVEGEACPDWLNFAHTAQAPDGNYYLTWRPIVDPDYGCHFTHEHGSNPERVAGANMPTYGYGTPHHLRESHYGFKTKALHAENGVQVLTTTHFGTAEPHLAVCQRFHWNNWQFVQDGELVADITFMGDFGAARQNDTDQPLDPENRHQCVNPLTSEVQSQAEISDESWGVRLNPVGTDGPFYYPWRVDTESLGVRDLIGFNASSFTVNTPGVVASCADIHCTESVHVGGHGAWAFINFRTGFGVADNGLNGEFYTNPFGTELREGHEDDAVRQYIKPGTNISLVDISDQTSYYADQRYGGAHGDYTYTQMANGDPNIMGNTRDVVDPQGYIQGNN
jgi:hypothetical protein